ncbi:MAG: hypothetical protein ACFFCI_08910 [Promethearchaeota archaeon]
MVLKNNEDDVLESLLKLSKNSLENKVAELKGQITKRQKLHNKILSNLATSKLNIEEKLFRVRYTSMFNEAFMVNRDFIRQINRIDELISNEILNHFQDTLNLKLKLQDALEELDQEKQKHKLLDL